MTTENVYVIVRKEKEKRTGMSTERKEIQMNRTMIFTYLEHNLKCKALDNKQGFISVYTFVREQNHRMHESLDNRKDL